MRIDRARLVVHALDPANGPDLETWTCGDDDLDDFVRSDALRLQEQKVVRTYLAVYDGEPAGYISLLADAVVLETKERGKLSLDADDHPVVPALKIARLGVSAALRATHRGCGEALVRFALLTALDLADRVGCRLLTVDAYPASIAFYARLGFVANRAKPYQGKNHPSMRFDVFPPTLPEWVI